MISDIDNLMQERGFDALLVTGAGLHNPAMVYLTGGCGLLHADLIKVRGQTPVLFHVSMERDEAARSGLPTRLYEDYPLNKLLEETGGDLSHARALRIQRMLADCGVQKGRVALYGEVDQGESWAVYSALREMAPELELVGEVSDTLLTAAMATKDDQEVERIRRIGRITIQVVAETADFLSSQRVRDGMLVDASGLPLTIGDVKRRIRLWLAEREAEDPHDLIFAIAYDSAVPHSTGTPDDILRLGQTIVFDIAPCEAGGGYFYDFTRTWCLGYAPELAEKLYADVHSVYDRIVSELHPGASSNSYQRRACQLFEEMGYPTHLSHPGTERGYVHGLGHGVGLNVHERPFLTAGQDPDDALRPGAVFTVEPGLYEPDQGVGVRIEDTYWLKADGSLEMLADYPKDLVLPVRKS